ncbi:MAG: hypothetical protein ACMUIP_14485 [bacterium]
MKSYPVFFIFAAFIMSCAPAMVRTPKEWRISVEERSGCGPFGMCYPNKKQIKVFPPWWLPAQGKSEDTQGKSYRESYGFVERAIINHELAHAWGIKGCKRPWCLMYEPDQTGCSPDNRLIEMLVKPFQVVFGFHFCGTCRKFLEEKGAFSSDVER